MKAIPRILLFWLILLPGVSVADPLVDLKTLITADRMSTESGDNRILFEGNVEARHSNMVLKADHLEVYGDEKKESFTKIIALGNVRVTKGDHRLEGGRAELTYADKKVVITENPVVFEKENKISGERIVYSYDNGGIMIEGGSGKKASVELVNQKQTFK